MSASQTVQTPPDLNVIASAASDRVGKEPDYEVWSFTETLLAGVTRYVTHVPRDFQIVDGIRFSTPVRGTGTVYVMAKINGANLFIANQALAADTQVIPLNQVVAAYQNAVMPAGAKIELSIISAPTDGSGNIAWKGLRMAWLGKTPGVSATNAGLCLPPLALWTPVLTVDPVLGSGGAPLAASYGSGIAYWPLNDTLLVVDNDSNSIVEMTTAGVYVRTIALSGFADVESVHYIDGITFAIVEEDLRTICVINIPATGAVTVVKGGANWVRTIATAIAAGSNLGLECVIYDLATDSFITTTEKAEAGVWNFWRVTNQTSPTVTALFSVFSGVSGIATDISDLAVTAAGTLLVISDEGATASDTQGRLAEFKLDGRLIQQTNLPGLKQAEGVALDPSNQRIFLCGERAGGTGMQLQVWQRP